MKSLTYFLMFSLMLTGACGGTTDNAGEDKGTTRDVNIDFLTEVEYEVSGMTCTGCENSVENSVNSLAGIQEVKASFLTNSVVVKYDSTRVSSNEIEEAIATRGYQVKGEIIPGNQHDN